MARRLTPIVIAILTGLMVEQGHAYVHAQDGLPLGARQQWHIELAELEAYLRERIEREARPAVLRFDDSDSFFNPTQPWQWRQPHAQVHMAPLWLGSEDEVPSPA